jgi:rhamnulokinase
MRTVTVAAADLGASSGRVLIGRVGPRELRIVHEHRFANEPVRRRGALRWDFTALLDGVFAGLRAAGGKLDGIGIDTWAVDYGLLGEDGLLADPVHYRDPRNVRAMEKVLAAIPAERIYSVTGVQFLPINTLYQLAAAREAGELDRARRMLMIPDLIAHALTGAERTELTNASTTQLLDVGQRDWSTDLIVRAGLPRDLFAELAEPGEPIGRLTRDAAIRAASSRTPVIAVGSHDTASAVAAVPAGSPRFAYISSGTWSLAGVELDAPVRTEASRRANFTNELGVDGTVRYLRNVMGLWLVQECVRSWGADLGHLLTAAAREPAFGALIDVDDPAFLPPGGMPERIAEACRRAGQPAPDGPAQTVRCILDSLALAYRTAIRQAQELSGREADVIHIVGGGSRNALLCQLTADACGLPVVAGPAEATALGNLLVQARALGAVRGSLADLRALLRHTLDLRRYSPASGSEAAWRAAEERLGRAA